MLMRIVSAGMLGGAAAGLLAGLLQLYFVQPVLLHAELYESGELVHFGGTIQGGGSEHDDAPVQGENDGSNRGNEESDEVGSLLRNGLSVLFSMLIYAGYGMVAAALMSLASERGATITARNGLIWGVAGFLAVQLGPGFSLAPEVPGVAAGDLQARQIWWFATAGSAALGLWLIAFGRNWAMWGAAMVLFLAPHLVGAPEPSVLTGPAPTEIGALFAARAFGVGLVGWVLLGFFTAAIWERSGAER